MNKARQLSATALFLLSACATTTPAPQSSPARPATATSTTTDDVELRRHLEDAHARIVRREGSTSSAPAADIAAARSIPIPEHRTVEGAVALFSGRLHNSIQTSLLRSAKYRSLIDSALEERDLPKGLAYLPVIESAYHTTLTSSAGAHGMWQFMPETAREYGLRVDWWVDERADPERSTRAAAAYLKDLYRQFEDWPLALAAYNCGPNRVKRTLASTGATTFWELLEMSALPKETRGYVPTFFATLIIASDPETYGFRLAPNEQPANDEKRVIIEGPVSLQFIAEQAGVDLSILRELNPGLRRGVVPPGRAPVRLPAHAAALIAARAASLKNEDEHITFTSFTVRRGDSLPSLARTLGTSEETLAGMNGRESVSRGETIYVPVRARELGALLRHSDDRAVFYTVRKGDTAWSIAKRHKLTVAELRELNALTARSRLQPGTKLRVAPPRGVTAGGM
jgi:membrane-bound lytic murein transglycosylase D